MTNTTTKATADTAAAVNLLLDKLGFAKPNERGWRDNPVGLRVDIQIDDERLDLFVFDRKYKHLLAYQISLPFSAPFKVIRATLEAAVNE